MIKKVIDFNRLSKQEYMKPSLKVVQMQHSQQILAGSGPDTLQGPNKSGDGSEDSDYYDLD